MSDVEALSEGASAMTTLGGSHDSMFGSGTTAGALAIDSAGNVFVTGVTTNTDFPVTQGAFESS